MGEGRYQQAAFEEARAILVSLQSLPVPHQGLGDSGDSGLHRAGGLCEEGEA